MSTDVLILGAGPVGLTAALLLARHGLSVEVIEKRREPWTDPRAVSLDDEALRIWQSCGVGEHIREDWAGGEIGAFMCTYLDARGRPFLRLRQRTGDLGYPHAVAIHQGRIDAKLLEAAERSPLIRVHRGLRVHHIEQAADGVKVGAITSDGSTSCFHAPWAVACDGGGSTVRSLLGIPFVQQHLKRPWLVANLRDEGEPGHVTINCSSAGAAVTMPMPHGVRRVEAQLDEEDDGAWVADEAEVRSRLRRVWSGAATAPILNAAVCRFKAASATRWREGRVFLAGDAAHVMPPFAGQGLGAGLRDAANLAFKLAGVVQGWLAAPVLDTYEIERRPHVDRMTRLSCRLGLLMTPRTSIEGTLIHSALRVLSAAPRLASNWLLRGPSIQPVLAKGFLVPSKGAGRYLPQPLVIAVDGRRVPLDALLGPRMTWVLLNGGSRSAFAVQRPLLQPADSVLVEGRDFHDPDGVLGRRYGPGSSVLVRPDRVVYVHIPASRSTPHERNTACRPEILAVREVRSVYTPVDSRPCSCPPSSFSADVLLTVPTPPLPSIRQPATTSRPLSNSTSSTPADATSSLPALNTR